MKSAKQWFDEAFSKEDKEFFFTGTEGARLRHMFLKMFCDVQVDALNDARMIGLKVRKKFTSNFTKRPLSAETDLFSEEYKEELDLLIEKVAGKNEQNAG